MPSYATTVNGRGSMELRADQGPLDQQLRESIGRLNGETLRSGRGPDTYVERVIDLGEVA